MKEQIEAAIKLAEKCRVADFRFSNSNTVDALIALLKQSLAQPVDVSGKVEIDLRGIEQPVEQKVMPNTRWCPKCGNYSLDNDRRAKIWICSWTSTCGYTEPYSTPPAPAEAKGKKVCKWKCYGCAVPGVSDGSDGCEFIAAPHCEPTDCPVSSAAAANWENCGPKIESEGN